jgi:hypothetical protein
MKAMSITIFETPVFHYHSTGGTSQILSFNEVTGAFKLANVVTGAVEAYTDPLDAECISFSPNPSTIGVKTDYPAIVYILSEGVSMIYNIPEWVAKQLVRDKLALNVLVRHLERVERMLSDAVGHNTDHGVVLYNKDLEVLCTSLLLKKGMPNQLTITNLRDRGFNTRPLNENYGWDLPVVETKRGLLIFG